MAGLVVALIALGTLAFGAVYPWGFLPLFAAAAVIGIVGLSRGGIPRQMRSVATAMLLVCAAVAAQLLPMPQSSLERLSPHAVPVLSSYNLTFSSAPAEGIAPLSIDPRSTQVALLAAGALGLYLLGLPALLSGYSLRMVPRALAVFAVPLALFAIYSRESRNGLIYWFWRPQDGGGSDLAGPFINRNHFGGWMLMAICLLIGWLFGQVEAAPDGGGRRGRRLDWLSSAQANGLLLTGGTVLVAAISLFWVMSRSAILGFAAGAAVFAWLVLRRRKLGATRRAAVLTVLAAVLLAGVAWRGPAQLVAWFQDETDLIGRLEAWRDGWEVVQDFPVFGTGLNTYSTAMLFYQKRNLEVHMAQAHNDYLQLLAEGGLLVTIPAAIAVVLLARAIRRNLRAAEREARGYWIRAGAAVGLLAIGVQELFEFSLQIPANALLFCTLAAVALTPVQRMPSASSGGERHG